MAFIQIVEFKSSRDDELQKLDSEWTEAERQDSTVQRATLARDRDNPNSYVMIVEFPSYEEAMKNSNRPETDAFAARLAALCDGPINYRNLDVDRQTVVLPSEAARTSSNR